MAESLLVNIAQFLTMLFLIYPFTLGGWLAALLPLAMAIYYDPSLAESWWLPWLLGIPPVIITVGIVIYNWDPISSWEEEEVI